MLTEAQKRVLKFVVMFSRQEHYPPTRNEISRAMGFKSPNAAQDHLLALEKKGVIEIKRGKARGIRVNSIASRLLL